MNKFKFSILLMVFGFAFLIFGFTKANAASLYFSPSSGSYATGTTIAVAVYTSSSDQAMNAASGVVNFPADKLEVISLSKTESIFNLWVQEPSFSNSLATVNFEGIVLNPGFKGNAGKILGITFKTKVAGVANVTFSSGSVLANDGRGTNILTGLGRADFQLGFIVPGVPETPTPEAPKGTPAAPEISSPTHPEENKWYSNKNPEFSWKLPSDVTGVSLLLTQSPTSNPGLVSDGLMESKKFEDVEDGIWYFHIKFKNQQGWGEITHRKVLIDTVPPESFKIIVEKKDPTDPKPILYFETEDTLSGVDYYEVSLGGNQLKILTLADLKTNPYQLPAQPPGRHLVEVKAYDKASNFTSASTEIEISPILTPTITKYPKTLSPEQNLTLEGESLADVTIRVFVQKQGKEATMNEVKASGEGKWSSIFPGPLEKGEYEAWVQAQDERGALSLASEKVNFEVGLPPFFKFGKITIDYLTIMIALIVLIIGAVIVIFYGWYRVSVWRKRARKETGEVAESVNRAFRALREEVQEQIENLDKKPGLTKEEKEIRDKLEEALNVSEEFISKEIKDVEKELE